MKQLIWKGKQKINFSRSLIRLITSDMEDHENLLKKISGTVVAIEYNGAFLIGYNKKIQKWELPGGGINFGETPRTCAIRETYEESSQKLSSLKYIGIAEILFNQRTVYAAVYYSHIFSIIPHKENDEWSSILLWNPMEKKSNIDLVGHEIIKFCSKIHSSRNILSTKMQKI